ncbi:MAG: OmpH family outer membrane protein [Phycisphaerales bacterium]|jgi:Skp family chaperone for outer membrane proteins|nr:OmpH family outer membrane protein [Phycisphaerales bacterium]
MKHYLINTTIAASLLVGAGVTSLDGNEETGVIGPADSIELTGKDGDLTLKNNDGHLSWGENKTNTAWSIGFMETGKALSQLMRAEHFQEARNDLNEELEEQISGSRKALDAILEEGKSLEPDDPESHDLRQRAEQIYAEFQNMQKYGADARAALLSEQMQESYSEIIDSVNVVADRMNIDMVLRFIPPDRDFEQGNPDSTIMQIRLRTALRLPEGIDITDDVLSELGLDQQ